MSPKRKQQDDKIAGSGTPSPLKRVRPSRPSPKRHASEEMTRDSTSPSPPKRSKHNSQSRSSPTTTSSRTRPTFVKRATKTLPTTPPSKSRLIPRGERKGAKIGQKDDTLLRMLCDDTDTGELKELHFRNMPHSSIDWMDAGHIKKINNWRNQIYGRAGLKSKAVTMWLPDEELWFELYFQLSIAESRARGILLPKTLLILNSFNQTFVGHILQDSHGNSIDPRVERSSNAFASKLNRMCPQLRARLHQCVFGKSGDIFVPKITLDMLHAYKEMKTEMADKGIDNESEYSEDLDDWRHLFSHLPSIDDAPVSTVEDDAAAVLISMATQPVDVQLSQEFGGEGTSSSLSENFADNIDYEGQFEMSSQYITPPQENIYQETSATPELFRTSFASTQDSEGPLTPARTLSFSDNDKSVSVGFLAPCSVTPVCELDIASLIASPD